MRLGYWFFITLALTASSVVSHAQGRLSGPIDGGCGGNANGEEYPAACSARVTVHDIESWNSFEGYRVFHYAVGLDRGITNFDSAVVWMSGFKAQYSSGEDRLRDIAVMVENVVYNRKTSVVEFDLRLALGTGRDESLFSVSLEVLQFDSLRVDVQKTSETYAYTASSQGRMSSEIGVTSSKRCTGKVPCPQYYGSAITGFNSRTPQVSSPNEGVQPFAFEVGYALVQATDIHADLVSSCSVLGHGRGDGFCVVEGVHIFAHRNVFVDRFSADSVYSGLTESFEGIYVPGGGKYGFVVDVPPAYTQMPMLCGLQYFDVGNDDDGAAPQDFWGVWAGSNAHSECNIDPGPRYWVPYNWGYWGVARPPYGQRAPPHPVGPNGETFYITNRYLGSPLMAPKLPFP